MKLNTETGKPVIIKHNFIITFFILLMFKDTIIKLAIGSLNKLVVNKTTGLSRSLATYALSIVDKLAVILTDTNSDDASQIKALAESEKKQIATLGLEVIKELVNIKVTEEAKKQEYLTLITTLAALVESK